MKKILGILFILTAYLNTLSAQEKLVDRVIATVGNAHILQSDLEIEYTQYLAYGNKPDDKVKCYILQQLLTQKLLAQQAAIDSIEVSESEIDDQLNYRIRTMIQRAGGKERLEEFLNRSILQHKEEMRPMVAEQMRGNKMQQQIISKVDVTPEEVKRYFNSLNPDSLPYFNTEIEYAQLVINPVLTKEEKEQFRKRAETYRQQVLNGSDFGTIARLYSEDPGSSPHGGELGFGTRETWVKEFSAQAFRLKKGEISPVFETQFGFHFLQVLERRGEEVNVRHVLIKKQPTYESLNRAKAKIDSIANLIKTKKLTFNQAASIYSDDQNTKYNGGIVTNEDRSTLIPMDQLDDVAVFNAIDKLKEGEISEPVLYTDKRLGEQSYRIYYLRSRIPPHKASLEQDFAKIKEAARQDKVNRTLNKWFESRRETTYIDINPDFLSCDELKIWTKPMKDN